MSMSPSDALKSSPGSRRDPEMIDSVQWNCTDLHKGLKIQDPTEDFKRQFSQNF